MWEHGIDDDKDQNFEKTSESDLIGIFSGFYYFFWSTFNGSMGNLIGKSGLRHWF